MHHFEWDDKLGLANTTLLGGRLGATFGSLLGLEAYYYTRDGVRTQLGPTGLTTLTGGSLTDQVAKLQHAGVDLRFQLGAGKVSPFAYGGAGVLRLEPDSGLKTDQIVIKYGAGIRFSVAPGVEAQLFAENARFRLDRYRLARGPASTFPADPDANKLRDNLAFGVGLGIGVGASKSGPDRERWSFASIPIEPFIGRLEFDETALGHQWFLGVRSGIDVGQYVGLRAFYMKGFDDRFDGTAPISSYGGEAQFNFNANRGPAPFLIAGAGRLDFGSDYRDANGVAPADRTTLILGGGLGIRLTDRFRLNGAARDFINTDNDLTDASSTSELRHNLMLSAGVTFALGRSRTSNDDDRTADRDDEDRYRDRDHRMRAPDADDDHDRRADRDDDRMRPERDRCERIVTRDREDRRGAERDSIARAKRCRMEAGPARRGEPRDRRESDGYVSDKEATFPVPTEGEIYIRYGKPVESRRPGERQRDDSMTVRRERPTMDMERRDRPRAERDSVRLEPTPAPKADSSQGDSLTTRRQREDSIRIAALVRDSARAAEARPLAERQDRAPVVVVDRRDEDGGTMALGMRVRDPEVYAGFNLDSPTQFVVGGLIDLRRPGSQGPISFVPEIALGFGDGGTSLLLAGNVALRLPTIGIGGSAAITPRARLGLGLLRFSGSGDLHGTQGVLNFAYGLTTNALGVRGLGRPRVFFEHQGIDLFDLNRLVVGFQWRR